jgi:hypothetical protein
LLNWVLLSFRWGTNWIYICYVEESRPPLWSSGHSSWLLNGDVLSFRWGTNWIYICYVEESRPPLWSSGHSSWLLNGDLLSFRWGTNRIYICYVEESRPPLWSSGQTSWLQIGDELYFPWSMCWTRLSEGISKHQQLKKKSAATALNPVLASANNLIELPDNRRLRRWRMKNDLPTRFPVQVLYF